MKWLLKRIAAGLVLLVVAGVVYWQWPRDRSDYERFLLDGEPQAGELQVSWWGVSAVLISDGETRIFIDPFFSRPEGLLPLLRNRLIPPDYGAIQLGLEAMGAEQLDAVLVSHSHYDHAMDAGVVANLTGAVLIGSESTLNIGRGAGVAPLALQAAEPGVVRNIGQFRVQFIPSRHAGATGGRPTGEISAPLIPPARYMDYRLGGAWSILIEHPAGNILHHASAGWHEGILDRFQADTVLLGVSLIDDLDSYLTHVVDAVDAKQVIPVHWDDFTRPFSADVRPMPQVVDLTAFFSQMSLLRPEVQVRTLPAGRAVRLAPSTVRFQHTSAANTD